MFFRSRPPVPGTAISLCLLLLLSPVHGYGQTPQLDPPPPVTKSAVSLREALKRTLDANPSLSGQRFSIGAASARIDQASLRPPIEIGVEAENFLGTNRLSAIDDAQLSLRLSTVIELGDKRRRRMDSATSERDLVANQIDVEKLDLLSEVARRFIAVAMLQEQYQLASKRLELASRTSQSVEQRIKVGKAPRLEGSNAAIAFNLARIERNQAASAIRQAWAELAALWGGVSEDTGRVNADLFAMPPIESYSTLAELIEQSPDILRFASERRVQDTKLRLAESQRNPDITVSAGVRRLQDQRSNAFFLSASIPFGSESRAAPYISEARNLREGVQYKEAARRAELLATLYTAFEQAKQSREEVDALLKLAIPEAYQAQTLAEQGYNVGRFSLLELITAQHQLTALQNQAVDAAASFHNSLLEIERLTGRSAADRDTSNNVGKP